MGVVHESLVKVEDGHAAVDWLVEFEVILPRASRYQDLVEDSDLIL